MTKASEVMMTARNASDAMNTAEASAKEIDQDWEHEATLYEFDDESVLVVSGPQCNVFDSIETARAALSA